MVKDIHQSWMSPFFDEPLIDDREPLIVDKNPPIATSFALIVDRKALIVDTKPLIAFNSHFKDFQNLKAKWLRTSIKAGCLHFLLNR